MISVKEKKYLVMSHNYWPAIGGAEKLLQSIAENLYIAGIDVNVLTSNAKNAAMYFNLNPDVVGQENEVINGVKVHRENIRTILQKLLKAFWSIFIKNSSINDDVLPVILGPHFIKSFIKYLFSSNKYSYIISGPFPTSVPFYGYLYKLVSPNSKLILYPCLHIEDKTHTGKALKYIAKKADAILVLTKEETNFLKSWGINENKIIETGVGIEDKLLQSIKSKNKQSNNTLSISNYILYIGQEVPHKNIVDLIDAMEKIWIGGISKKLVIAGAKTDYSPEIDKRIEKLDKIYQKNIIRLSNFDEDIKINLIDNCEILVLPSSKESFGIVIIEAWARKKPVIGTNVPGIRYLIDDKKNGLLFEEHNSDDLKEKIQYLIKNKNTSNRMGINGYNKVIKKYNWKKIINKILTV